ncbi:hypothetical protein [Streptomyces cyaneofuscatus]
MSSRTALRTIFASYLARHPSENGPLASVHAALDAAHPGPSPR